MMDSKCVEGSNVMGNNPLNHEKENMTLTEKLEQERVSQVQIGNTVIYLSFNQNGRSLTEHLVDYFGRLKSQ